MFEISRGIRLHVFRQRLLEDPLTLFVQIAIALASVTALTRQRWLLVPAGAAAVAAVTLVTLAYY